MCRDVRSLRVAPLMSNCRKCDVDTVIGPDEPLVWPSYTAHPDFYTSGTTSRGKCVVVTHANYAAVGRAVAGRLSLTRTDRWFSPLPLLHVNAQYYRTMSALVRGAPIAVAGPFSASRWGIQTTGEQA